MPVREQWDTDRTLLLAGEDASLSFLGTTARDSATVFAGHQSAKFAPVSAGDCRVRKTSSLDLSSFSHFEVMCHADDMTGLSYVVLNLYSSTSGHVAQLNVSTAMKALGVTKGGWRRVRLARRTAKFMGGFAEAEWADIRTIELSAAAKTDMTAVVYVAAVYAMNLPAAISIEFDDGYKSVYETAYPILDARRLAGSANINTRDVGATTRMTWPQLRELQHAGWAVCNHTHSHIDLKTATVEQVRADLATSRKIMKHYGFDRGANYLVAPFGSVDATRYDVYYDYAKIFRGGSSAALLSQPIGGRMLEGPRGYMKLDYTGVGLTCSIDAAKAFVDELILRREQTCLNFHNIIETASASTDWPTGDFTALMDYIAAKRDVGELLVMNAIDIAYQTQGAVVKDNDGHAYISGVRDGHPVLVDLEITPLE